MKEINVNAKLLDLPPEELIIQISRLPTTQNPDLPLKALTASLETALKYQELSQPHRLRPFLLGKKIPFDEIYALLKDSYQGKFNDYLQEILDNAEIELLVDKKQPNQPNGARQLEIKIRLAAAVIDKYADLLTMVIGEKTSKAQNEIIQNATQSLKTLNERLNGVHLLHLVSQMKSECQEFIAQHKSSHCLPFFCTGKTTIKLKAIDTLLADLMHRGFSSAEVMGGLLLLEPQLITVFNKDSLGNALSLSLNRIFLRSHFDVDDTASAQQMSQAFVNRAKQLEVEWAAPFNIGKTKLLNPALDYPSWSPII